MIHSSPDRLTIYPFRCAITRRLQHRQCLTHTTTTGRSQGIRPVRIPHQYLARNV